MKPGNKLEIIKAMDALAPQRELWQKRSRYYYQDQIKFFRYHIPAGARVLEVGCGTGSLLSSLGAERGLGIDISDRMIDLARKKYQQFLELEFKQVDAEEFKTEEKFDYIIISDTIIYFEDIQRVFDNLKNACTPDTRIIITYHNFLWSPILKIAEWLGWKMPQSNLNWVNGEDIVNFLNLSGFETVKTGRRLLFPKNIWLVSWLVNKYFAHLPLINRLCLVGYVIARPAPAKQEKSVSVIIPARNEKENILNIIERMPRLGLRTEIIFIEGGSSDGTFEEIERVSKEYRGQLEIKYAKQDRTGKGDAVRKGFAMASGEILMILDADLTVPPEDLVKFYEAIASGQGEFINGCRLVYPVEKEAMRFLNMAANKFFSLMFSWLLDQRLKDTLCGTKVISKYNYRRLIANRKYFGEFDPFGDFDLLFGAAKLNLKIVEMPIRYKARQYGETNISRFRHGWLLLKMVIFAMNKIKFI